MNKTDYRIRVKGELSAQWLDWFDGLTLTVTPQGETELTGAVNDQAALHGLLAKIRDLNLCITLVERIES
ncbi:MAG: hypothetical protein LWX83_06000 [Anaerolineae bacterium]|nr:hypothetical protein [Anaerolineae bacterium]